MRKTQALAALLLALFVGRVLHAAAAKSATFDEAFNIAVGTAVLRAGDWRLRLTKPTLSMTLQALPHLASGMSFPGFGPAWRPNDVRRFSLHLLHRNAISARRILLLSRCVSLALALGLGWLVFRTARACGGDAAGLWALGFYTFSPDILAHAGLATEDLPVTAFVFAAVAALDAWLARPTPASGARWGAAAACAAMAKFSGLLALPAMGAVALCAGAGRRSWWAGRGPSLAAGAAGAAAAFAAAYGVVHVGEFWGGLQDFAQATLSGHRTFFHGETSQHGFWYFMPAAFLLKTPLPLTLLAAAALVRRETWKTDAGRLMAVPALAWLAAAAASPQQSTVRYLLPVYPFLAVLAGRAAAGLSRPALASALGAWYAGGSLAAHPHHLAYVNELGGGPRGGWRFLVDSNLDWGQDLGGLAEYLREAGSPEVVLAHYGCLIPEAAGFPFQDLFSSEVWEPDGHVNSEEPRGEVLAVSVTCLQGVYTRAFFGGNPLEWLKERAPAAVVGHTIRVYDITRDVRAHEWLAHTYLVAGQWAPARREIRRALRLDPGARWALLLSALAARGPEEEARAFAAAAADPDLGVPWPAAMRTGRARQWYARGLEGIRAEAARRGDATAAERAAAALQRISAAELAAAGAGAAKTGSR